MSERLSVFRWLFSTKKQVAYATALADNDLTRTHAVLAPGDLEEIPTLLDDAAEAGRGTEWAGLQSIERWDAGAHRETWGTPEILGWLAAFWFGSVVTSQPDAVNAPLVYQHAFSVLRPPTTDLPVTTIIELGASTLRRKVESVVVATLEMSADVPGRLKVTADLVGSGKVTLPGGFTPAAVPAESQVFFRTNNLVFTLGGVDVSSRLLSWRTRLDNALLKDPAYEPGSGLYRARIEYGARRPITFECTLKLDAAGGDLATLRAGTVLTPTTVQFDGTDTIAAVVKQRLIVSLPKMNITKAVIGDKDSRRTITLTCEVLDDQVAGSPVTVTVRNANSAYLN
jgi:hypothetical protein